MASKTRGRERLGHCDSCSRTMPRDKMITYNTVNVYSTDLKTADDVKSTTHVEKHYCISCAKSKRIFEKLKNRAIRQASRAESRTDFRGGDRRQDENWNSGRRW